MIKRTILLVAATLVMATAPLAASAEEIRAGGGGAPVDGYLKPVKEAFEKSSGISLKLNFSSATLAFKQLMAGELDVSTAGVDYPSLLAAAKKEGIVVADPAAYVATTIGASKILTMVHKENPVPKLSLEQVRGIFTGKIANWKELGGKDAPILVVLSSINPATNAAYKKLAMGDEPFTKDVLEGGRFEDVREKIAANPEAIGFGPITMLDDTIKTVETPEVSRPVIVVTKGAPSAKVQKLVSFIKGEGSKLVKN